MSPDYGFGTGSSIQDINKGLLNYANKNGFGSKWGSDPNNADLSGYQRNLGDTGLNQAQYNRPSTSGPFGASTVGADGSVKASFSGGFGTLNDNLTNQAANVAANPMDWGQFGTLGTGADAGKETAQAAYSQSLSRLDPFWKKSQNQLQTNLFQSGMADSTAGDSTMGEFGRARNDAYSGAMSDALGQGMTAQQNAFNGNLASRQNNIANALRGQTQPFEELGGMQSFLTQPQVGQDNSMMVRDSAYNQSAPVQAWATKENAINSTMENGANSGLFQDTPGDKSPGGGERRKKWFESLPPAQREFILRYAGAGSSIPDPGY